MEFDITDEFSPIDSLMKRTIAQFPEIMDKLQEDNHMNILFASGNKTKVAEVRAIFEECAGPFINIVTPEEVGLTDVEVDENGSSYRDNAYIKARAFYEAADKRHLIYDWSDCPQRHGCEIDAVLADDSGYEVAQWDNLPGLKTHRLLKEFPVSKIDMTKDCTAFQCSAICFYSLSEVYIVDAKVPGIMINQERGNYGSYYMNSFIPNKTFVISLSPTPDNKTFGELGFDIIIQNSARARALDNVINTMSLYRYD